MALIWSTFNQAMASENYNLVCTWKTILKIKGIKINTSISISSSSSRDDRTGWFGKYNDWVLTKGFGSWVISFSKWLSRFKAFSVSKDLSKCYELFYSTTCLITISFFSSSFTLFFSSFFSSSLFGKKLDVTVRAINFPTIFKPLFHSIWVENMIAFWHFPYTIWKN